MFAPDEITFEYLKDKPMAPKGDDWPKAVEFWKVRPLLAVLSSHSN